MRTIKVKTLKKRVDSLTKMHIELLDFGDISLDGTEIDDDLNEIESELNRFRRKIKRLRDDKVNNAVYSIRNEKFYDLLKVCKGDRRRALSMYEKMMNGLINGVSKLDQEAETSNSENNEQKH